MSAVIITDPATAKKMVPLLDRGRKRFSRWMDTLPLIERPIGITGTAIILREDFVKHAELCFTHVLCNAPTLYILCEASNSICAVFSKKGETNRWLP